MNTVIVKNCKTLFIGRRGENEVTEVLFDFSEWQEQFGAGVIDLYVKRNLDIDAYPVVLSVDGTVATWLVSAADTDVVGNGKIEYVYTVNEKIAKSAIFQFFVGDDIGESSPEPPEHYQSWLEQLTELGAETQANAQAAAQSASEAAESASEAAESASEAAESAAQVAEDSNNAEAWAVGERNGEPVSEGDPTYDNNAKYWAENARANAPVQSVNGEDGYVVLTLDDIPNGETYVRTTPEQLAQIATNSDDIADVKATADTALQPDDLRPYRTAAAQDAIDQSQNTMIGIAIQGKQAKITASGILKGDGAGGVSSAVAGTDYATPQQVSEKYTKPSSGIPSTDMTAAVQASLIKADTALQAVPDTYRTAADQDLIDNGKQAKITASGILKGDGAGGVSAAVAGVDYLKSAPVTSVNGQTGDVTIQTATDAQVTTAVNTWLGENVAQETGYVLDDSLTMSNAAPPASAVGDLKSALNPFIESSSVAVEFEKGGFNSDGAVSTVPSRIRTKQGSAPIAEPGDFYICDSPYEARIFVYNSAVMDAENFIDSTDSNYKTGLLLVPDEYVGKYVAILIRNTNTPSASIADQLSTIGNYVKFVRPSKLKRLDELESEFANMELLSVRGGFTGAVGESLTLTSSINWKRVEFTPKENVPYKITYTTLGNSVAEYAYIKTADSNGVVLADYEICPINQDMVLNTVILKFDSTVAKVYCRSKYGNSYELSVSELVEKIPLIEQSIIHANSNIVLYNAQLPPAGIYIGDFTKVYDAYDELCTLYPNFIERKADLGNDADGNAIRHYYVKKSRSMVFETDSTTNVFDTYCSLKRVLLTSGVHGGEKPGVWALYYFIRDYLSTNSAWSAYIERNYDFDIVPVINPWGYNEGSRTNKNGVNINRDYNTPAASRQPEATAVINLITSISNNLFAVMDSHTTATTYGYLATPHDNPQINDMMKLATDVIQICAPNWLELMSIVGFPSDIYPFAYGCLSTNDGTLTDYVIRNTNTNLAFTVETLTVEGTMKKRITKMGSDMIGNMLLNFKLDS